MARLEELATGTRLTGLAASGSATVESVQWIGEQAVKVIFRDGEGKLSDRLLYRDDEPSLELVEMGRPWSFDGDFQTGCDHFDLRTRFIREICIAANFQHIKYLASPGRLERQLQFLSFAGLQFAHVIFQ